ncbi:MAG: VWA domain-containing protein [Acidobacteria bacterium]|nr:MAG: VWA domain-containing protein [Acidobacteriota bacterium]
MRPKDLVPATLAALLLCALPAPAQEEPQPEPSAQFGEEIDVRLVQIPILAHDRKGRPITDLRPEDVEVKHDGRPMRIAFLEPFHKPRPERPLPEVRLKLELPGGADDAAASGSVEPQHVIFYIDVENDQPLGKSLAIQQLIRFVDEGLDPSYRAAVVSFNGEIHLDQPFTSDRRAITRAIRDAFDQPRRPQIDLQLRIRQLIDRFEDCIEEEAGGVFIKTPDEDCVEAVAREYADEVRPRARDFLIGLEGLIRFAGGLDGRKSVVAVTHGTAVNPAPEIVEAMRAVFGNALELGQVQLEIMSGEGERLRMDEVLDLAIRNQVTLHFVDRTQAPTGDHGARLAHAYQPGAQPMHAAWTAPQQDLREIARTTGGSFVVSQDLFDGVKRAMDLERGGYYLGYYTDVILTRDQLSKVVVRSARKGVRITHQRGSYARPKELQLALANFRGRIDLGRPQRLSDRRDEALHVPFRIVANPRDLGYAPGREVVAADLTLHVRVEQGAQRLADVYHFVNHAYPRAVWEAEEEEPLVIDGWVELPLGEYRLVAVFKNARSGDGGQLEREVVIASRAARSQAGGERR